MYRKYGITQRAREGGACMYRKYGITQGARDGGAYMYRMCISHHKPEMAVGYLRTHPYAFFIYSNISER